MKKGLVYFLAVIFAVFTAKIGYAAAGKATAFSTLVQLKTGNKNAGHQVHKKHRGGSARFTSLADVQDDDYQIDHAAANAILVSIAVFCGHLLLKLCRKAAKIARAVFIILKNSRFILFRNIRI